eukprot:CAMPEP_0167784098 /NCGR_PEP_ID=MMETSP0111_2-20121227/7443_1 /TAXON_ID=91324 /ORGANISM="Lotharella globosa, Strain CCCM811" /LENGTH=44 /DNA_ID= /DNA_START= /DNA_END= /DNA_ORIENTATION=
MVECDFDSWLGGRWKKVWGLGDVDELNLAFWIGIFGKHRCCSSV